MTSRRLFAAPLAMLLAASMASAQSLGDVAKQETERRKSVKAAGKVYTNDNVRPDPTSPAAAAPSQSTDAAPAPSADPAPSAATKPDETKTEAYWKKKFTIARDSLSRSQTFAEALQTRVNALSA